LVALPDKFTATARLQTKAVENSIKVQTTTTTNDDDDGINNDNMLY
jgi:hypothetical protein